MTTTAKLERFQKAVKQGKARQRKRLYPLCRWGEEQRSCRVKCAKTDVVVARRQCAPGICRFYEEKAVLPADSSASPLILFLANDEYRGPATRDAIKHLEQEGWQVHRAPVESRDSLWGVPGIVESAPKKPDVVLRWEEAGCLFVNDEWRKACAWMWQEDIKPMQIDWGYFNHYRTFVLDIYEEDGTTSILSAWPRLAESPLWEDADPVLQSYRTYMENEWDIAGNLGPVPDTEPGYVLLYIQFSNYLSVLRAESYKEWVNKADAAIRGAGLEPVWKRSRVQNLELPQGSKGFIEGEGIDHLNTRLIRYARHSVIITSTVSNEAVLRGLPIVACGRGCHSGLGVFAEAKDWKQLAVTPKVDARARGKWINWWIERQCAPERISQLMRRLVQKGPRLAVYLTGIGLGNQIMAVPAMKAFSLAIGAPIDTGPVRRMASGYPELLKGQPWIRQARHLMPDTKAYDMATAAAFPGEREYLKEQAGKMEIVLPGRAAGWPHEIYRNAEAARNAGFRGILPSTRLRVAPPQTKDLPVSYVAVGMDCTDGPTWSKRRWPHWERFAELWQGQGMPLVFLGVKEVPWAEKCDINLIGQTSPVEMAAIIQEADAYLGVDNGPSHVASAVRTPSVLIYGPTTSLQNGPWHGTVTVLSADVPCRPCIFWPEWHNCTDQKCLANVRPERVVDILTKVLRRHGQPIRSETCAEQVRARVNTAQRIGIPAAQRLSELAELWDVLEEMQPHVVVEIGSLRGGWLYTIAPTCAEHAHLLGIDPNQNGARQKAAQELAKEGHKVDWVSGDSHSAKTLSTLRSLLRREPVDVLHIDGDHSRGGVLNDWEMYSALVRSGGLIILHDAANPTEEVPLALAHLQHSQRHRIQSYQVFADPNGTPPLGIGVFQMK